MSEDDSGWQPPFRTVTPGSKTHHDPVMQVIGWIIAAGLAVVMLPLLPFVIVIYIALKLKGQ